MKKEDEKILADLMKKYNFADRGKISNEDIEFVMASISYVLKVRPNLNSNNPLSIREILCLAFLAAGKNPDKCADLLGISAKTIKTYEQRIREKLGARNRTNALYLAQIRGFISIVA